jgi:hypothetical protein
MTLGNRDLRRFFEEQAARPPLERFMPAGALSSFILYSLPLKPKILKMYE